MPAVLHRLVGTTVRDRVVARLRREEGFGLVELLIAMLVMALGIMALVAAFSSGMVALNNASRTGTAGTLADKQMEAYRALPYGSIRLGTATPDAPYTAGRRLTTRLEERSPELRRRPVRVDLTAARDQSTAGRPLTVARRTVPTPVSGPAERAIARFTPGSLCQGPARRAGD
jgi:type II secretory pathway pseudopilin PulG